VFNRLVRALASGWTVSGTLRYSSGLLTGVPGANNNLGLCCFKVRA
jgi:hypothetical protein